MMTTTTTMANRLLTLLFLLIAPLSLAKYSDEYYVFDYDDWYFEHWDETECFDRTMPANVTSMMYFCPIPNPYSNRDPLYVKIGSICDDDGYICCLQEEYECVGGELYCGQCDDCLFPQILHASCCGVMEQACDETEICCKCGINNYKCIQPGEECEECSEEITPSPTPFADWDAAMTTPTPPNPNKCHEEL